MNVTAWLFWGFVATIVLTTIMAASQGLGLTRMNIPYLLGAMFTRRSSRAKVIGFFVHLLNGLAFALLYVLAFHTWHVAPWWCGAVIGVLHAGFVLAAAMTLMPHFHPRMAREDEGPDAEPRLEPPGFLALHYGIQTPISVLVGHVLYGAILGAFYPVN